MEPEASARIPVEQQLEELRHRVDSLEFALRQRGIVPPAVAAPPPAASPASAVYSPPVAPEGALPGYNTPGAKRDKDPRSLEDRIGTQWFNRIGIIAILIGVAWLLKLAMDNNWLGPLSRILIGLASGIGLIAWSERFRRRDYVLFAYSLKGVGSGVLYLSLWAAFDVYHVISAGAAFAAMLAVTALNATLAWRQNAELLALYAIVGGISTPVLLSTGGDNEVTLFLYLLMLDLAVLLLVALRPWPRLLVLSFLGTAVLVPTWWADNYRSGLSTTTALFVLAFFVLFALSPRLVLTKSGERESRWSPLALVMLPLVNACLGFAALYAIYVPGTESPDSYGHAHTLSTGALLALGFAAFYAGLLRVPPAGPLRESSAQLTSLHLTLAVLFLSMALPLETHGRWLIVGWVMEGAALLAVAERFHNGLLRVLGCLSLALGVFLLVAVPRPAAITPVLNQRFATYCVAIAAVACSAWTARRGLLREAGAPSSDWQAIALVTALSANALVLLAAGWEIHNYWWSYRAQDMLTIPRDYRILTQFSYSAFFMAWGALLMAVGFWKRSAFLRWQSLVLLALAIGKVFLIDGAQLSQGYRILSFLGLGVLLLVVSFVYQRDWLNLRGAAAD